MQTFLVFIRIFAIILSIIGTSFLLPVGAAVFYGEYSAILPFLIPMAASWILGMVFYFSGKKVPVKLGTRAVFVFVSFAWIAISFFGAIPLYAGGWIKDFSSAVFEAVSGFTTTGATVLADVEVLPRCVNLWRMEMHWLGGMGIIPSSMPFF